MIPLWGTIIISVGAGLIIGVVVKLFVVPQQRTKIKGIYIKYYTDLLLRSIRKHKARELIAKLANTKI